MTRLRALAALALASAVAACAGPPVPSPSGAFAGARQGEFELTIHSPRTAYRTSDAIPIVATLAYGGGGEATVYGPSSGPVGFTVVRVADGLTPGEPGFRLNCAAHTFQGGVPERYPFQKSGGFGEGTPNLDFVETYFADPDLHLPAGTWHVVAVTEAALEDCGGERLALRAEIEITVAD